jgi:uncharacterized membrane protein
MNIIKKTTIGKPVEEVWEVLGNQFGQISNWASLIKQSKVYGDSKLNGVNYSIRETNTLKGITKQEITSFEPEKHSLSYKSISGTPAIIKEVRAHWSLVKNDSNSTKLVMDFTADMKGLGFILAPIVKMKLSKIGDQLLEELKYYLENGKQHPRKIENYPKGNM